MLSRLVVVAVISLIELASCSQVEDPVMANESPPQVVNTNPGGSAAAKDFSFVSDYSDQSETNQFELGVGFDATTMSLRESGLADFKTIDYFYNTVPSISGYVWNVRRQDILSELPTSYDEAYDPFYETQFRHFGIDSKTTAFVNSIETSDRAITVFMYSTGQSSASHLTIEEKPNSLVASALATANPAGICDTYGDSYIREVTNGWIVFLIVNVVVDSVSQYDSSDVWQAFFRLEENHYTASASYTESDLLRDEMILESKGVRVRTFAFSNLKLPGVDQIKGQKQYNEYLERLRKSDKDSVTSPIRVQLWNYNRLK